MTSKWLIFSLFVFGGGGAQIKRTKKGKVNIPSHEGTPDKYLYPPWTGCCSIIEFPLYPPPPHIKFAGTHLLNNLIN